MKRLFAVLALVLAACLFLSACYGLHYLAAQSARNNITASAPAPEPTPDATTEPTSQKDDYIGYDYIEKIHEYLQEYYADQIEEANSYRTKVGDTEYYFDTSIFLDVYYPLEFPLYRNTRGEGPEYLGTTGFAFQVFGDYIYLKSDALQEDWPDGTLTRVIDLNDLSVTPVDRNINIFIPKQGSKVYYTSDGWNYIYIANASLKNPKKLHIKIPDKKAVDKKVGELYGEDISYLTEDVGITNVENGWIYFYYWMFEYEGDVYYEGNYRIKTDGSKTEKTDEGKFGDEIGFED